MKINKFNFLYFIGIYPLFLIMNLLILKMAYGNLILFYSLCFIFLAINYWFIKKIMFIPRAKFNYENCTPVEYNLPIGNSMPIYASQDFDNYDLVVRTIEVYSPLFLKNDKEIKLIISEKLLRDMDNTFNSIAMTREILKFRTRSQIKILLRLMVPVIFIINIILLIIVMGVDLNEILNPFILNFVAPFISLLAFLLHLYNWNIFISKEESKLDKKLLDYYSVEEVVSYIKQMEKIEGRNEKEKYKELNWSYTTRRINKLKNSIR